MRDVGVRGLRHTLGVQVGSGVVSEWRESRTERVRMLHSDLSTTRRRPFLIHELRIV